MDTDDFAAFTEMALFLAERGDGVLEDDEMRVLVGAVATVGGDHGLGPKAAVQLANDRAHDYVARRKAKDLHGITEDFHGCCLHLRETADDLPRLYRELVQVAASDGELEPGEQDILHHVRRLWALDN